MVLWMTQFGPSFSWRTDGFTLTLQYFEEIMVYSMTSRCPGPVAAEQAHIITPPPPCLLGLVFSNMELCVTVKPHCRNLMFLLVLEDLGIFKGKLGTWMSGDA
ncbi:hypothetical protein ILYODFUR_023840 [Ilyodon furcidens]|uniref:Uncharacterized protein n=1 Tax=Ilyodon furcidens TaxID=33524 RepID=A0ABV0TL37_9TELE